jgi:hypothetical protein
MEPEGSLPHTQVPVTCPILSQLYPVHTPTSHLLKIHHNTILPSRPGSSNWPLSVRFPHQNPAYTSAAPHTRYMPRLSHSSQLDHPENTGRGLKIIKLHIV